MICKPKETHRKQGFWQIYHVM